MKKEVQNILNIALRYSVVVLIGVLGVGTFYILFLPLTIYPVYFLLKLFFDTSLASNIIMVGDSPIEIIGACIAGSAYYLLLILNFSTRGIKMKQRLLMLLFSFSSFLVINILRIFLLSITFVSGFSLFDLAPKFFWYVGSTVFVVGIWFFGVKIFRAEEIPFYSDILFLLKSGKKIKKPKSSKKH